MKYRSITIGLGLIALLLGLAAAPAPAQTLTDNFDTENGGAPQLNYTGFQNFDVTAGSVDLIGNGFFDLQPGNGLYVDLNGSTFVSGTLVSKTTFAPGTYNLSFKLAGSQRGDAPDTVNVTFGDYSQSFTLQSTDPFATYAGTAHVGAGGSKLSFATPSGDGDNIGLLLDNVKSSLVPEPDAIALFLPGIIGLGLLKRRRKTRPV